MNKYLASFILFCSILFANKDTVAISYFDNTSNLREYDAFSKGLADMLITDLSKIKSLQIVEREKLESLLKEINLSDNGFINVLTAQKMGKGLGAKYILTGGFFIMDDIMRIDARLIEVETGAVIMAEEIDGEKSSFFSLEKELANKLINALAISTSRSEKIALKRTSTESFDAFLAYSDGLNQSDKGEYETALSFMEKALGFDETFEKAAIKLDDINEIIDTGIDIRTRAFPIQIVNLIDQLSTAEKETCEIFENTYMNFLFSIGTIDGFSGGVLLPDSSNVHQKYNSLARYTFSESWNQGNRFGMKDKPKNYEEFLFELGKKDYIAYGLFEYLLSKELNNNLCGVSNPNKKAYEFFLGFILDRYNTSSPVYQHRVWPHMVDQDGIKVIDKWDYRKLYIKYGSEYLEKFPFGDSFTTIAQNVKYLSEIEFENDELWTIKKWLHKHDRYNDVEQNFIYSLDTLNLSHAEYITYYSMEPFGGSSDSFGTRKYSLNSIPKEIGVLQNLKILDLTETWIQDMPVEISKLANSLEVIDLRGNFESYTNRPNVDLDTLQKLLPNTIILSGNLNPFEKNWRKENPEIYSPLFLKETSTEDLWFLTIAICADILNHASGPDEINLDSISLKISVEDLYLQTFAGWNDSFPISIYGYFKQFMPNVGSVKVKELSDAFDYLYRHYNDSFYNLPTYKKIKKLHNQNKLK